MTSKYFSKKQKKIREKISSLNKELSDNEKKYIQSNSKFYEGDKVLIRVRGFETFSRKVPESTVEAFVRRVWAHDDGNIRCSFLKVKKDGTASPHRLYIDDYRDILNIQLVERKEKT